MISCHLSPVGRFTALAASPFAVDLHDELLLIRRCHSVQSSREDAAYVLGETGVWPAMLRPLAIGWDVEPCPLVQIATVDACGTIASRDPVPSLGAGLVLALNGPEKRVQFVMDFLQGICALHSTEAAVAGRLLQAVTFALVRIAHAAVAGGYGSSSADVVTAVTRHAVQLARCRDRYARGFGLELLHVLSTQNKLALRTLLKLLMAERWCPLTTKASPY